MRSKITYAVFLLTITALLALNSPPPQGPHGGIVKNAEGYYIEMKNNPDTSFVSYLLNKKLKTVSSKGISGEVKFFSPDSTTLNVQLKPGDKNAFTAKPPLGFYACKITFNVFGKSLSATFEKQNQTALKK